MMRQITTVVAATFLLSSLTLAQTPIGTIFTYQGKLLDNGLPANGQYDLSFELFAAPTGGSPLASELHDNVDIVDGVFTVELDMGNQFTGNERWLQIGVRPGISAGAYTTLDTRQPLNATPYALYALNGNWQRVGNAITNSNTGFVGVGRSTPVTGAESFGVRTTATDFTYGGMYLDATASAAKPFYGYKTGSGAMWTYLDGASGSWRVFNDDDRLTVQNDGKVGIGTTTPSVGLLDVLTGNSHGIYGKTTAAFSYGVYGVGTTAGVRGESGASGGAGVYGVGGSANATGVRGDNSNSGGAGVAGYASLGTGVYGQTGSGYGVYGTNGGSNSTGYAGYFNGRVHVAGQLSKLSGSFKIDHPLDPANKYLYHSFVESPDMMNIYNGNVQLDANGAAVVTMPEWFDALNHEFRYQLTPIGNAAPNLHVAGEMDGNTFMIAGGQPNQKVSWQVTGVRQDPWARDNPVVVEESKPASERGKFLYPAGYGQPDSLNVGLVAASDNGN